MALARIDGSAVSPSPPRGSMSSQNPKRAIYEVLRKAQADGTLSQTQDARALARFFLGVAWGINAVNKSVADPGVFRDIVRVAMTVWNTPATARPNGSAVGSVPAQALRSITAARKSPPAEAFRTTPSRRWEPIWIRNPVGDSPSLIPTLNSSRKMNLRNVDLVAHSRAHRHPADFRLLHPLGWHRLGSLMS